ncbi:Hypothetical predicted protein [Mytilus galloprovincialis]|uniref:ParB/Sulfiredoxin domain-containing protein n=1 Tax=Mytilus galloprovincialis TaxID=29158 RepID=A0A8B6G794_MYTGA|nr:Hypothetical predicted protein [Mytilus galloprovincialis]
MGNTASDYGPNGTITEMRPSELRFTQDSVSCNFQDGHSMDETLRMVLNGSIPISRIPPLVVMNFEGSWYVVRGNRRLYLYQLLERNGKLQFVKVIQQNFDNNVFKKQFTSKNNGRSIRLRGDRKMKRRLNEIIGDNSGLCVVM